MLKKDRAKHREPQFMDLVQQHERSWGTESYSGKPDLSAILSAQVVVFWREEGKDERNTVTLHKDLGSLEEYFSQLLFRSHVEAPRKRPVRIYENQRRIIIKGVRVEFVSIDE